MITPDEVKLLQKLLNDEQVDQKEVDKLSKKLDLIVEQINIQDEANKKLQEVRKKLDKLEK